VSVPISRCKSLRHSILSSFRVVVTCGYCAVCLVIFGVAFCLSHIRSGWNQVMRTLISSASLWYSQRHERWLSARELLTLQGFPVLRTFSYDKVCCSFAGRSKRTGDCSDRSDQTLPDWPSRSQICRMAGNTMHCNVVGVVMMYVWTQVVMDAEILSAVRTLRTCGSPKASTGGARIIRALRK